MSQIETFEEMKLLPQILSNIQASGYTTPTPIQKATIPLVMQGRDVLGCAQTGTGKTAAFALPILQNLHRTQKNKQGIRCLVLTPTRELAQQIQDNFVSYGQNLRPRACVVFGGVNQNTQVNTLERGCDILTACPGRLWDLMQQGIVSLDHVEIFVLDEADRMLDMGFIRDVRKICEKLPERHQTLLFSATMPKEVEQLAMDLLHNPETVKVDPPSSPVKAIEQSLYRVDKANKKHLLAWLLKEEHVENALVFSRTKHGCDRIVRDLKREGIDSVAIHGDKTQNARVNALTRFKSGDCKVMIATDIAARGLDIEGLSHVINYDLPNEPEAYIHRIGRTGRAGHGGIAISFCCIDEVKQLGQVEKLIGFRIKEKQSPWPMEVFTPTVPQPRMPRGERPAKLDAKGNPAPEKKPQRPPVQETRVQRPQKASVPRPAAQSQGRQAPKNMPRVAIGKDGKMRAVQPEKSMPRPVARVNRRRGS